MAGAENKSEGAPKRPFLHGTLSFLLNHGAPGNHGDADRRRHLHVVFDELEPPFSAHRRYALART